MSDQPIKPIFDGPPPPAHRGSDQSAWIPTVEALRAKPGEWAIVLKGSYSAAGNLASRIRTSTGAWAGSRWEATTRTVVPGRDPEIWVWARYVGEAAEVATDVKPLNGTPSWTPGVGGGH